MCRKFGLKFTQTIFTSDFSNRNADNVGFKLDVAIKYILIFFLHYNSLNYVYFRYDDVIKSYPRFKKISGIKSNQMTIKTLFV